MNSFQCPGCKKTFTQRSNLFQHLEASKNVLCHDAYYSRSTKPKVAKRAQPAYAPPGNKKRVIDNIERLLQQTTETTQPIEPREQLDVPVNDTQSVDFPLPDDIEDEEPTTGTSVDPVEVKVGDGVRNGLDKFRQYLRLPKRSDLMPSQQAAIELMSLMDTKGGSIALYNAVMDWHLRHLTGNQQKISADNLHETLIKRYGMEPVLPYEKKVRLDTEEGEVPIVCHDCEAQTVDLLTDPRIRDTDYLFPGDDPEGAPPQEWKFLSDIDTGRAYIETYRKLIEPRPYTNCGRKRVLLPYIFYLDSCVTGQTQNQ